MPRFLSFAPWVLLACCSAGPRPAEVAPTSKPHEAVGSPIWTELTVRWDFGPCDPGDPRSCHQSVRVTRAGEMVQTETPNPGVSPTPKARTSALAPAELAALQGLVDGAFVTGMKSGFPCSRP